MMSDTPPLTILVVAAGRGERAGSGVPKQYRSLLGRPVLAWTVECLRSILPHVPIRAVIAAGDEQRYAAAAQGLGLLEPVLGGATRQESVKRGLESVPPEFEGIVLIHDAARPFPSRETIRRVIDAFENPSVAGAAPGLAVSDSLKRCLPDGEVLDDVSRERLHSVQTPQAFRFPAILDAHRDASADLNATDDLAISRHAGGKVIVTQGNEGNLKITTADDFARAEAILLSRRLDVRVGQGFDVHAFGPGDHVTLCGVRIPHEHSLAGHSDADVALHALTDAVLGAIGAGDIGVHFPPSDAQWRGAASDQFLAHAARLVAERDGIIAHVDVTIICEAPRIGPYREAMVNMLSEILGLPNTRISVKGTTTERLGFTGRREGIAAMATATIRLPA